MVQGISKFAGGGVLQGILWVLLPENLSVLNFSGVRTLPHPDIPLLDRRVTSVHIQETATQRK